MEGRSIVFILCEASCDIGYGHFKRCLALAGGYQLRGFDIIFLMRKTIDAVTLQIADKGMGVERHADFNACLYRVKEAQDRASLLIIDHYEIGPGLEKVLFGVVPILVLDDLLRFHYCDILVDQTLGRQASDYQEKIFNPHAMVLTGSRYTILDPVYLNIKSSGSLDDILISFGATDPYGWALKMLEIFGESRIGPRLRFHLPLSSVTPCRKSLELFSDRSGLDIAFYWDLPDLSTLYRRCGVALGAPGTSLFERLFCGLVNLTLVVADNQAEVGRRAVRLGLAQDLGDAQSFDAVKLVDQFDTLINQPDMAESLRYRSKGVVDGQGSRRILNASLNLIGDKKCV